MTTFATSKSKILLNMNMKKTYATPTLIVYQTESEVILSGSPIRDFGMDDLPSDPGFFDDEYDY